MSPSCLTPFNLIASHELQPTKVPLALYHNTRSFCRGPHTLSKVSSGGSPVSCIPFTHSQALVFSGTLPSPDTQGRSLRFPSPKTGMATSSALMHDLPTVGVSQKKSRMLVPRLQPRPSQAAQVVRLAWHQQNEDLGLRAGSHRGFITDFCGTKALPAPGARAGRY